MYHGNGIRAPSYTRQQYSSEWHTFLAAAVTPYGFGAQGGTFCCNLTGFDISTPSLLPSSHTWSEHFYPLSVCKPRQPNGNTVWDLLADAAAQKQATEQAPLAALAMSQGIPFIYGETNSISCGGQLGVSDTFASALWAVDQMFNAAAVNITGFRFHGCYYDSYTPIAYANPANISDPPLVKPLFYGIWAFTVATAHNARVVQASINSSEPMLKAWVTVSEESGLTSVVFIHKNGNATAPVAASVVPPSALSAGTKATLRVLSPAAGGVYAKQGLSFGGLTFDGSPDGLPVGMPATETVTLGLNGAFQFSVSPASVAILTYESG